MQYAQLKLNEESSLLQKATGYFKKETMQPEKAEKKLTKVNKRLNTIKNRKKRNRKKRKKKSKKLSLRPLSDDKEKSAYFRSQSNPTSERSTILSLCEVNLSQASILHVDNCRKGLQLLNMIPQNITEKKYKKAETFANQLIQKWEEEYNQHPEKNYLSYLLGRAYFYLTATYQNMPTFEEHEKSLETLEKAKSFLEKAHPLFFSIKHLNEFYSKVLLGLANNSLRIFKKYKEEKHNKKMQLYAQKTYDYYIHSLSYKKPPQLTELIQDDQLTMLVQNFPKKSADKPKNINHLKKEYEGYSQVCQHAFDNYSASKTQNNSETVAGIAFTIFLCEPPISIMQEKVNNNPFLHLLIGKLFRAQAKLFKLLPDELYKNLLDKLPHPLPNKQQQIIKLFEKSMHHLQLARQQINPDNKTTICYSYHDASIEYFRTQKSLRNYKLSIV